MRYSSAFLTFSHLTVIDVLYVSLYEEKSSAGFDNPVTKMVGLKLYISVLTVKKTLSTCCLFFYNRDPVVPKIKEFSGYTDTL